MMAAGAPGTEPLLPWTPRGVAQVDRAVRTRFRSGTPACCGMAPGSRLSHMRLAALTRSAACCADAVPAAGVASRARQFGPGVHRRRRLHGFSQNGTGPVAIRVGG